MKKVLFVAAHRPERSPSQRFRFEQYFGYLNQQGFDCRMSYIITAEDDRYLYKPGFYLRKLGIFVRSFFKRSRDVFRAANSDIVFIQREAFMTGSIFFEKMMSLTKAKLIFDFDDSIWLQDDSPVNNKLAWLKNASKTSKIIERCDMVFAGNQYLADYASDYSQNIKIVPTTIDTEEYFQVKNSNKKVVIGWSGSFSTVKHFEHALPVLRKLKAKYSDQIEFKLIGDGNYVNEELEVKGIAWSKENEIPELLKIDIGIMPLPDDLWAKGKCGLKGLQYMALGIATVMSPVGVNVDIIQDGVNGFLASSDDEWVEKISILIDDKDAREKMGLQGRLTVENEYSVLANQHKYLDYFNELLG